MAHERKANDATIVSFSFKTYEEIYGKPPCTNCPNFFLIQLLLDKLIFNKIVAICYKYFTKQKKGAFGIKCQIQLQKKHEYEEGR